MKFFSYPSFLDLLYSPFIHLEKLRLYCYFFIIFITFIYVVIISTRFSTVQTILTEVCSSPLPLVFAAMLQVNVMKTGYILLKRAMQCVALVCQSYVCCDRLVCTNASLNFVFAAFSDKFNF